MISSVLRDYEIRASSQEERMLHPRFDRAELVRRLRPDLWQVFDMDSPGLSRVASELTEAVVQVKKSLTQASLVDLSRWLLSAKTYRVFSFADAANAVQNGFTTIVSLLVGGRLQQVDVDFVVPQEPHAFRNTLFLVTGLRQYGNEWQLRATPFWGDSFGDQGYCYLTAGHFQQLVDGLALAGEVTAVPVQTAGIVRDVVAAVATQAQTDTSETVDAAADALTAAAETTIPPGEPREYPPTVNQPQPADLAEIEKRYNQSTDQPSTDPAPVEPYPLQDSSRAGKQRRRR